MRSQATLLSWSCNTPTCEYYPEYKKTMEGLAWYATLHELVSLKKTNFRKFNALLEYVNKIKYNTFGRVSVRMFGRFRTSAETNTISYRKGSKFLFNVFVSTIVQIIEEHDIHALEIGIHVFETIPGRTDLVRAHFLRACPKHNRDGYMQTLLPPCILPIPRVFCMSVFLENVSPSITNNVVEHVRCYTERRNWRYKNVKRF